MYDNEILSELRHDISTYVISPTSYVESVRDNMQLPLPDKINALCRISSTPITKSNSFIDLPTTTKRIWMVVAHIASVDFITNHIEYARSYERIELLHGLIQSIITNFSMLSSEYQDDIGIPQTQVLQLLKSIETEIQQEGDHHGRILSFPSCFFQYYPRCVLYLVTNFNFEVYCLNHKVMMLQINDVDVNTGIWENNYIRIINKKKLTEPYDSFVNKMIR